jgi:hypothetical protein
MGYTARAALERLRVANAIEELPVIAEAMDQGSLSFFGRARAHAHRDARDAAGMARRGE